MTQKQVVDLEIKNQKGLHARAAAAFVRIVDSFNATVNVTKSDLTVGGNSIMGLMMLSASKNSNIRVEATGEQAEDVINALRSLVDNRFGEE